MQKIITRFTTLQSHQVGTLVIAIVAASVTFWIASSPIEASLIDGEYHPWGYDSFYVAALVNDIVESYPLIKQFDEQLHPLHDSASISFTWAYTLLLASIVVVLQVFAPALSTTAILVYLPPVWGAINCLLFIAVCRKAGLRNFTLTLAAAGFALAPYVRDLHLIGNIDHHFMELFFILLIMFSFLSWIKRPASSLCAVFCGAVLGVSVAFHFALFVMYLPIALFFLICWINDRMGLEQTVRVFLLSVTVATLLAVLPSAHFHGLEFSYYRLSWFHLYWAVVFSGAVYYLHRCSYNTGRLVILGILLIVASIPVVDNWRHGASFLVAELPGFTQINETRSIFEYLFSGEYKLVNSVYQYYSGLLYLVPFALILLIRQVRLTPRPELVYVLCACCFGAVLLFLQLRFKYHAPYVLLLPVLLLFQQYANQIRFPKILAGAAFVIFYMGPMSGFAEEKSPGGEPGYKGLVPFLELISQQCSQYPGVLLAHPDEGHYLRYHTDCKILSTNMLATVRDFEYRALAFEMLAMSATELVQRFDWVDYVYVRLEVPAGKGINPEVLRALNQGAREELLLDNQIPAGTKSLASVAVPRFTYQRLLQTHNRW